VWVLAKTSCGSIKRRRRGVRLYKNFEKKIKKKVPKRRPSGQLPRRNGFRPPSLFISDELEVREKGELLSLSST